MNKGQETVRMPDEGKRLMTFLKVNTAIRRNPRYEATGTAENYASILLTSGRTALTCESQMQEQRLLEQAKPSIYGHARIERHVATGAIPVICNAIEQMCTNNALDNCETAPIVGK
jgi:hypothetical protein